MVARRQPPSTLSPEELRIGVAMRELRRGSAMARFRERIYGPGDPLDIAQHDALEVIAAAGSIGMGDLAAALRVDPSTATRTVARLEAAGLVQRARQGHDGRAVAVAATPDGTLLHARLRLRAHDALGALFARFDPGELRTMAELLERLVAGLDELSAEPRAGLRPAAVSD